MSDVLFNIHVLCILVLVLVEADDITVTVKQGKLKGHREATILEDRLYFAFYGVPYARPPVGKLRFKNPRPAQNWDETFDASVEYHGACAQTHIVHKFGLYGSEDCLYLNIYTPNLKHEDSNLKPVIVWIHGYAFTSSLSHIHGPDFFINKDVILITVAHRIGVFGFLKLNSSDSHANMGLKDIVMALRWIKVNIKQFGGDKNKITLMGSGSGATYISLLMITKATNLFSKVVLQSGGIYSPSIFQMDPESERHRLEQELKRKHLKLKRASTNDIVQAAHNIYIRNTNEMINFQRPIVPFTPTIEPVSNTSLLLFTPKRFYEVMKNEVKYFNKPILIGYNTQESISEMIPFLHNPYYLKKYIQFFNYLVPFTDGCRYNSSSKTYKKLSSIIRDKYFKEGENSEKSLESLLRYASDLIKFPIIKFIKAYMNLSRKNIYMYKFDYKGTLNAVKATAIANTNVKISGVASGDEICYLLRCEPFYEGYAKIRKENNKDIKFINDITLLWSNFAKFADPTPPSYTGNTTWLPINYNLDKVLLIRYNLKMISSKQDNVMYDFWNLLYETYYKEENCDRKRDEV